MSMCGEIENVEREIAQLQYWVRSINRDYVKLQARLRLLKGEDQYGGTPCWIFEPKIYKDPSEGGDLKEDLKGFLEGKDDEEQEPYWEFISRRYRETDSDNNVTD